MNKGDTIIDLRHIVKRFFIGKPNELEILHGIDLQVKEGEFLSVIGESGSGKSTLMNIIGVLDRPTEEYMNWRGLTSVRQKTRNCPQSVTGRLVLFFRRIT